MRHELQNESQKTANFRVENEKMSFISSSLEINAYITRMLYNNHLVNVWVCCALALTTYILILTVAFTFIFIIIVIVIVMVITSATTLVSMRMGQGATCGLFIALFIRSESVSVHATVIYVIFQKCLCISHFYHAVCAPAAVVVVVVACGTCLSCTPHFTRIDANKRPKRAKIKTERERERENKTRKLRIAFQVIYVGVVTTTTTILRNKIFYNWVGTHNDDVSMWVNALRQLAINLCTTRSCPWRIIDSISCHDCYLLLSKCH